MVAVVEDATLATEIVATAATGAAEAMAVAKAVAETASKQNNKKIQHA